MVSLEKFYKVTAEGRPVVSHHDPGTVEGRHVALEHLDGRLRSLDGGYPRPVPASPLALQDQDVCTIYFHVIKMDQLIGLENMET